jgi:hypothetical protein
VFLAPARTEPVADRDDARGRVTAVPQPTDIRRPIRRQGIVELSRIIARWPVVHQQGLECRTNKGCAFPNPVKC